MSFQVLTRYKANREMLNIGVELRHWGYEKEGITRPYLTNTVQSASDLHNRKSLDCRCNRTFGRAGTLNNGLIEKHLLAICFYCFHNKRAFETMFLF